MIDVIIPYYNSNQFISRCLLSLVMQTIKDKIKIYIIDDASDACCNDIVDKYKSKLNIQVIRLDVNKGPGNARNVGILKSSSDYIFFMDSDDELINSLSLESLLNAINDSDITIGKVLVEDADYTSEYVDNYKNTLHGKLYKREFLKKHNIIFNDTYRSEDNSFHNLCLLLNPRLSYVKFPIYYYKYNHDSLSDVDNNVFLESYNYNVKWVIDELKKRKVSSSVIASYIYKAYIYNYYFYNHLEDKDPSILKSFKNYLYNYFKDYMSIIKEEDKLRILNENMFTNIQFISLEEFDNLILS